MVFRKDSLLSQLDPVSPLLSLQSVSDYMVECRYSKRTIKSLSRRDPYLDPLAFLQIELLRKYRDETQSETDRMQWQSALPGSINAIAAGLRYTGLFIITPYLNRFTATKISGSQFT